MGESNARCLLWALSGNQHQPGDTRSTVTPETECGVLCPSVACVSRTVPQKACFLGDRGEGLACQPLSCLICTGSTHQSPSLQALQLIRTSFLSERDQGKLQIPLSGGGIRDGRPVPGLALGNLCPLRAGLPRSARLGSDRLSDPAWSLLTLPSHLQPHILSLLPTPLLTTCFLHHELQVMDTLWPWAQGPQFRPQCPSQFPVSHAFKVPVPTPTSVPQPQH